MSFLYRTQPVLRQAYITARPSSRLFTTASIYHKTATDTAKDALKSVDRTVSDAAVSGIDKGLDMKDKAASAAGIDVQKPAEGTTQKASGEAIDQAKGAAQQAAEKTKQTAEQAKQKAS